MPKDDIKIHAGKEMTEMREKIEALIFTSDASKYTLAFILIALGLVLSALVALRCIDYLSGF